MNYQKAKVIGILACSAEGAALCYKTICLESQNALSEHAHPDIILHGHCLAQYMENIEPDCNWENVAILMQSSYDKLCQLGAKVIVCPDNTIHQAYDLVRQSNEVVWLHIANVVAQHAKRNRFRKVGILGTKFLMEGPVYPEALQSLGIATFTPGEKERLELNRIIFEELVNGVFTDNSRRYYAEQIEHLRASGCDAVVLGCTEIPLLIEQSDSCLPVMDSTRLLARAAIAASVGTEAARQRV